MKQSKRSGGTWRNLVKSRHGSGYQTVRVHPLFADIYYGFPRRGTNFESQPAYHRYYPMLLRIPCATTSKTGTTVQELRLRQVSKSSNLSSETCRCWILEGRFTIECLNLQFGIIEIAHVRSRIIVMESLAAMNLHRGWRQCTTDILQNLCHKSFQVVTEIDMSTRFRGQIKQRYLIMFPRNIRSKVAFDHQRRFDSTSEMPPNIELLDYSEYLKHSGWYIWYSSTW